MSDDQLQAIYEAVKWAPTAMNSRPLRVSADARAGLEPHVAAGNPAKLRSAPVTAILSFDTQWHEHLPALMPFAEDPHLTWRLRPRRGGRHILPGRAAALAAAGQHGHPADDSFPPLMPRLVFEQAAVLL